MGAGRTIISRKGKHGNTHLSHAVSVHRHISRWQWHYRIRDRRTIWVSLFGDLKSTKHGILQTSAQQTSAKPAIPDLSHEILKVGPCTGVLVITDLGSYNLNGKIESMQASQKRLWVLRVRANLVSEGHFFHEIPCFIVTNTFPWGGSH